METTIDKIIGSNLKEYRARRKWNQADVLDMLRDYGIPMKRNTISAIENGTRSIKAEELWALSRLFDVPVWGFFWPTSENLDAEVVIAGHKPMAAHDLVTPMLQPPDEDLDYNPRLRAFMLVADSIKNNGVTPAAKAIQEASR